MPSRFIENKYYRWYVAIVSRADEGANTERHHILPRSMGGDNSPVNLVRLSLRKHFLAHWLLTKCTEGVDRKRMLKALGCMIGNRVGRISSWQYAKAKAASREGSRGGASPFRGKKHTEEARRKQALARKGKPSPMLGKATSEEVRRKQSAAKLNKKMSPEFCAKNGQRMMGNSYRAGQLVTSETRQKISVAGLGNQNTLGKKASDDTKQKMSIAHHASAKALRNNKLGLKGVVRHQGKYRARSKIGGKFFEFGSFDCPAAAHLAYCTGISQHFGSVTKR